MRWADAGVRLTVQLVRVGLVGWLGVELGLELGLGLGLGLGLPDWPDGLCKRLK